MEKANKIYTGTCEHCNSQVTRVFPESFNEPYIVVQCGMCELDFCIYPKKSEDDILNYKFSENFWDNCKAINRSQYRK